MDRDSLARPFEPRVGVSGVPGRCVQVVHLGHTAEPTELRGYSQAQGDQVPVCAIAEGWDMTKRSAPIHAFVARTRGASVMEQPTLDALFDAGCDDAVVGTDVEGDYLDFARTAPTFEEAVHSACAAVESVRGLEVVRIEPYDRPDDRLQPAQR